MFLKRPYLFQHFKRGSKFVYGSNFVIFDFSGHSGIFLKMYIIAETCVQSDPLIRITLKDIQFDRYTVRSVFV